MKQEITKKEIIEFTEKEAFELGKGHRELGFDISYNPYRNLNSLKDNIGLLQNAWHEGFETVINK